MENQVSVDAFKIPVRLTMGPQGWEAAPPGGPAGGNGLWCPMVGSCREEVGMQGCPASHKQLLGERSSSPAAFTELPSKAQGARSMETI